MSTKNVIRRALWPADVHLRVLIVVFLVVLGGLCAWEPATFLQPANFTSMALQISDLGVLSLAMMLAMVLAGIDLSVIAVANLSSILAALAMSACATAKMADGLTTMVGVLVGLLAGIAAGMINGFVIGYLRVPPILATLATMTLWGGAATVLTNGVSIPSDSVALQTLGTQAVALVPVPTLILIICVIAVWIMLSRTPLGVKTYLLGANSRASLLISRSRSKVSRSGVALPAFFHQVSKCRAETTSAPTRWS